MDCYKQLRLSHVLNNLSIVHELGRLGRTVGNYVEQRPSCALQRPIPQSDVQSVEAHPSPDRFCVTMSQAGTVELQDLGTYQGHHAHASVLHDKTSTQQLTHNHHHEQHDTPSHRLQARSLLCLLSIEERMPGCSWLPAGSLRL